ncbi:UDP-N-acetylmuramoyl-tripeptide--D-alanyl-D-alanine ligase [Arcanobacterium phocae]|uniref:UDP-N-acetylmuramoyl-tripeptide--D-alanyl-D-alanine ligase n=1 Tax=Arcanobacterium phocae TaxID=131112 RepID=A0A1H2LLJ4_9ACTO|nr:UDP-N-acetylmuramoyl-tripeptide--D-alanyl-D-alanine ligase [Arcanobacterium phocae]SDU81704.1 UDP-N-acetylmuramoyl-tripeptide--D-alanyl-D-alanine ligase [Arcanobacterium phocae]
MIKTTLEQIANVVDGNFPSSAESAALPVSAVATDNRQITGGELFVAIAGERVDGNRFAAVALTAGATGVLTADRAAAEASGAPADRIITVADPILALGKIAHDQEQAVRKSSQPNFKVIGVTGSVGKTTTKDLLADLLRWRGPIIAPPGSFNNELGLPLTVLRAHEDTATLVLEMGADHIGNLDYLTGIAAPDISVVLAVARAHLGEFGGIENVAKAKSELVTGTRSDGVVVLNYDDERVRAMARLAPGKVVFFSVSGQYREGVWASNIATDPTGKATFTLHHAGEAAQVALNLVGTHHVANALAAATVAIELGATVADCATRLSQARADSPHRMDVWESAGVRIIDDSYNANPDSMRAGLQALAHIGQGQRTIAVLGQMLELGEASASEHESIGHTVADLGIDKLIALGDGVETMALAAQNDGVEVHRVADISEARLLLDRLVCNGDVVLLKGSNGSGVWQLADALKEKER